MATAKCFVGGRGFLSTAIRGRGWWAPPEWGELCFNSHIRVFHRNSGLEDRAVTSSATQKSELEARASEVGINSNGQASH